MVGKTTFRCYGPNSIQNNGLHSLQRYKVDRVSAAKPDGVSCIPASLVYSALYKFCTNVASTLAMTML